MNGLGQTIFEKGLKKGREEGFKQGLEILIKSGKISQEDADELIKTAKIVSSPFTIED